MGIQYEVANFAVNEASHLLKEEHFTRAKEHMLDTMGVALAGHTDAISEILINYTAALGEEGECSILGTPLKTSVSNAAFVNGILCHSLDYDDSSWRLIGHPSAVVLPAILATAEKVGASGEKFLTAFLIGVEVSCKLGYTATPGIYQNGWHATSAVGILGATAGVGYLLDLTVDQMVYAFGISASSACGLRSNFGTMTKPFHAGIAAKNGLVAAFLAKYGFTSCTETLEGSMGFFTIFSGEKVGINLKAKLGDPFDVLEPGFFVKPYPSCAATHTAIDAILQLKAEHHFTSDEVINIRAGCGPVGPLMLIHNRPKKGAEGKFSMPYVLAAAVNEGRVGIDTFTDEKVSDPNMLSVMGKVDFFVYEEFKERGIDQAPAFIQVHLADGRVVEKIIEYATGSPSNPMALEALKAKYVDCASRVLEHDQVNESMDILLELEELECMSKLITLLKPNHVHA